MEFLYYWVEGGIHEKESVDFFSPVKRTTQAYCPFSFGIRWLVPSHHSRLCSTWTFSELLSLTTLPRVRHSTPTQARLAYFLRAYHYLTLP